MKNKPIILIISIAIISILILVGTIYAYYRSSLIHLSGTIDKDFFPAFGSFVGATIGLLFSIASVVLIFYTYQSQQEQLRITRSLVDRQISLSIKPVLVVEDFDSSIVKPQPQPIPLPDAIPESEILPKVLQNVPLRILNVGIEAAQYIQYGFDYDIGALISYMNSHLEKPILNIEYIKEQDWVKITHAETHEEAVISLLSEQRVISKDYLLPYKASSDFLEAIFPKMYLLYYYHIIMVKFKGRIDFEGVDLENFPPCYLNAAYKDLEGRIHKKRFDVKLSYAAWSFSFTSKRSGQKQLLVKIASNEIP